MAADGGRSTRPRGRIETLPSGSLRVSVFAGRDPVTKRRHYLREVVPAGPKAEREAQKVLRRLASEVDERRSPRTTATVNQLLDRYFEVIDRDSSTVATYVGYADRHIRPLIGAVKVEALEADVFDSFYAELRRCRLHCDRRSQVDHRTAREHVCDRRCRPHVCRPLGPSTVRQIHFVLSGALKRAVRWRWIATNPIDFAEPPTAPKPNPSPPTPEEAARLLTEAWRDPEWGLLVWLVMVTGLRRGELCSVRWRDVDLTRGVLMLSRSVGQRGRATWEKDTKSHQHRRLTLDQETVALLVEYRARRNSQAVSVGARVSDTAFVFSRSVDGSTHLLPNSVSQRYAKLAARLGLKTSLHKLRHYSATELIAGGVDVRTVAGRLGHGGGGTTTLRFYTAWVSESDQRASSNLHSRMPTRPLPGTRARPQAVGTNPYEQVAHSVADEIDADRWSIGDLLPSLETLASEHDVSSSTVQRAMKLLESWSYLDVTPGRGCRVM